MKNLKLTTLSTFFLTLALTNPTHACTDFRLTAKDGTLLVARSMEFEVDLKSNLRSSTQNRQFTETAPDGKPGMTWKAKYGYVYLDGFGLDVVMDGMNESGLTFEYLYLPGETQYGAVPDGKDNQALAYFDVGAWVLSNFKTIDEVKAALASVYVYPQTLPGLGNVILPAHASIYDASGKGIVVEFVNGKTVIHDNIGVMTNSPTYDWQVTNLRNYLNLTPYNPKPVAVDGMTFSVTGQGAGMVGLPGDVSPPSRFVKTAFLAKSAYPVENAADLLNLAEHIINNVDIPNGLARTLDSGKETTDTTEWVIFKDITHKMIYWRTYNDMTLRSIAMSKVDFSEKAARLKMPIADKAYVMDETKQFLGSKG